MFEIELWKGPLDAHSKGTVFHLYEEIFGEKPSEKVEHRLSEVSDLLLITARIPDGTPVGYKLGYAREAGVFYSWLGGVLPAYRHLGIGEALARAQHEYAREQGYYTLRTKTMPRWAAMIRLNERLGFHLVSRYTNESGEERWVMEKGL